DQKGCANILRSGCVSTRSVIPTSCSPTEAPSHSSVDTPSANPIHLEITERFLRDVVKSKLARLVRSSSQALLVEEMEVCLGRARIDLAVIADYLIGIEIKGPKDDVTRLPGQVQTYSKCFDRV